MNGILEEVQLSIAAMPVNEAVARLFEILPREKDIVISYAQLKTIMGNFYRGLISRADYDVSLNQLHRALDFFLSELDRAKIRQVFDALGLQQPEALLQRNILFVESMPMDQQRLQLDVEYTRIEGIADAGSNRLFAVAKPLLAATLDLLIQRLNRVQPQVVHFSGHGHSSGIVLSTADNRAQLVPTDAISRLFSLFANTTECVLLNACYSTAQAAELSKHIKYVIGMDAPIDDDVAIEFTSTFYTALCNAPVVNYKDCYTQATVKLLTIHNTAVISPQLWSGGIQLA